MKKTTKEWFTSAESDLLLIQEINSNENLTHLSAFHAQQSGEMGLFPNGKPSVKEGKIFFNLAKEIFKAAKSGCK